VIRLSSAAITSLTEIIPEIRKTIDSIDYTAVSDIHFLDEHIAALYDREVKISKILFWIAFFSITISCMGLFSMSLFAAESRTKEIGIRKAVGATMADIMIMLNRDSVKWIAVAFLIAAPAAWLMMRRWLELFAYRTKIGGWIFVLAGIITLSVALITVSWQTWKAASRNPVESLRYE
jgi:putative ABC transport system permease protein